MNNLDKKCEECGELLEESQYLSRKREGEPSEKNSENPVCRNFPECIKAEKE